MSTYGAQGDQWTIETPDRPGLQGQPNGNGSTDNAINNAGKKPTVRELTKDLMDVDTDGNNDLGNELDFDLGERNSDADGMVYDEEDEENKPSGRSRRKKQLGVAKEDETTVALSMDGNDSDEEDRTIAFSDPGSDEEDATVAMSVVDDHAENTGHSIPPVIVKDTTISVPSDTSANGGERNDIESSLDEKNDSHFHDKNDLESEDDQGNDPKQATEAKQAPDSANESSANSDDEEMEFDMPPTDKHLDETEKPADEGSSEIFDGEHTGNDRDDLESDDGQASRPKPSSDMENTPKSANQLSVNSDDDEEEMEFDMPTPEEDIEETEESADKSPQSTVDSKQTGTIEDGAQTSPKERHRGDPTPASTDATTPRRSVRARKPRVLYSAERHESTSTPKKPKAKKAKKSPALPADEEWIAATDVLFVATEDKSAVTVKQIFLALEDKFQCKITKQLKSIVRNRLKALITGTVEPSCATDEKDDGSSSDPENESEDEPSDSDDSEDDADDESSEYSDEEAKEAKRKKLKALAAKKKKKASAAKKSRREGRPTRPKRRKATARAAAKIVEAHKLRQKKRAEELKVRNEEMQLDQTKEDEERQEAIAAKFETNTDELRLKRLEERLDLLQRLDETRISVVAETLPDPKSEENTAEKVGENSKQTEKNESGSLSPHAENDKKEPMNTSTESSSSDSEESSSDEEDLIIVGMKKPFKPLKPLHNHLPSRGLQLLDEIRSPKGRKTGPPKSSVLPKRNLTRSNKDSVANSAILSPNRSMGARFALRNALKQKQRKQGNRWLARELGYKTEEDHLKDCQIVADQKRGLVVKLEKERLKANERKQLRERLILQEQQGFVEDNNDDDPEDEAYVPEENDHDDGAATSPVTEEEDEEMKMAKEIEQEARNNGKENEGEDDKEEVNRDDVEEDLNSRTDSPNTDGLETQPFWNDDNDKSTGAENDADEKASYAEPTAEEKEGTSTEKNVVDDNKVEGEMIEKSEDNDLPIASVISKAHSETGDIESNQFTETKVVGAPEDSVVTPDKKDSRSDDEGELEFDGNDDDNTHDEKAQKDPNRPRNAGWQAMLEREAEKLKKRKKRKGGLVEEEAEEEEEEEIAGLEDFGFSISKKKKNNDEEDDVPDQVDEDDLKHVVDDVSDDEGDEDAGRAARKRLEQQEEKARHKEILRRMREGYDGRRGGIAGGGAGARGMHRFDQLVAADNREDAKRLGLLNDDELDSEDEKEGSKSNGKDIDEEEDETALLDKMLKDRFLHRSDVNLEENFSEDEDETEEVTTKENSAEPSDVEVRTQERLAKRFAKRARMQRLEEMYGDSQEFSQQRLIDEDVRMKEELSKMRCGLLRRSSSLSRASSLSRHSSQSYDTNSNLGPLSRKRQRSSESSRSSATDSGSMFQKTSGSLSIALRASQKRKHRTSFLGGSKAVDGKETSGSYKVLSLGHVLFNSQTSKSGFSNSLVSNSRNSKTQTANKGSSASSLFSKVSGVTK